MIEVRGSDVGDHALVGQDHDPVGELGHLVEPVGDEDHPGAARRNATPAPAPNSFSTSSP
ncbi:MAG: hypothetical protein WB462_06500 [Solirubrobacterales bacterium]